MNQIKNTEGGTGIFIGWIFIILSGFLLLTVVVFGGFFFYLNYQTDREMDKQCEQIAANGGQFGRMDGDKFKAHCTSYWAKNN